MSDSARYLMARSYYAHAGFEASMTHREVKAGETDWDAGSAALSDVAEAYEWADGAYDAALAEDAERFPEVIHHVSRYGNVISCGATGPVRVEEIASKVTCPDCNEADRQHLIDNAHAE